MVFGGFGNTLFNKLVWPLDLLVDPLLFSLPSGHHGGGSRWGGEAELQIPWMGLWLFNAGVDEWALAPAGASVGQRSLAAGYAAPAGVSSGRKAAAWSLGAPLIPPGQ